MRPPFHLTPLRAAFLLGLLLLFATGFRLGALPFIPAAPYSDAALSHWPAALYLRQSVLDDRAFPVWRDGIMGAQPFAANPLNKTAYPLQWLALLLPASHHLDVMAALHLLLAGWGMWRWARRLQLSESAAAVSALGYALGPRLLAHTGAGHLDIVYALAWWPWLMGEIAPHPAAARTQAGREGAKADWFAMSSPAKKLKRTDWAASVRAALFAALLLLADVRLSLFALTLAAAYALYARWRGGDVRQVARLWPAALLLPVLTASLMLPLLGWRPYLSRAALTPADAGVFSLAPAQLLGLFGLPTDGGNPELLTYVGLSLFVLALAAVSRSPRRHGFWLAVAAVVVLYALGVNSLVWTTLVQAVPTLLWFRVPSRAWLVLALVIPLLAGYGVDALLESLRGGLTPKTRQRGQLAALVGVVATGVGGVFLLVTMPTLHESGTFLLLGATTALVVWLALGRRLDASAVGGALLILVFADVSVSGERWLTWRGPEDWLMPGSAVAEKLDDDDVSRVYAPYILQDDDIVTALPQPVAAAYRLSLFGGVDPFQLAGMVDAVARSAGSTQGAYDVVQPPIRTAADVTAPNADVLAAWGVSHVVSPVMLDGWLPLDTVGGAFIYRNPVRPRLLNPWGLPDDWPGLPNADTIRRLNGMTVGAWALSTAALVGCAAGLLLQKRRRARV